MSKIVQSCLEHEGVTLFYEASLRQRIVSIDIFTSEGVLKLSRNIKMPKQINKLYSTKNFIIGVNQSHSTICVCNVLNINQKILVTDSNLQKEKNNQNQDSFLDLFYYDANLNLILFVSDKKLVNQIILQADNIRVKNIYKSDHPIDKLQIDSKGNLYLLIKLKKILLKVQIDWNDQSIFKESILQNVIDFCFRNGWDLIVTEQQRRVQEKFNFKISSKGQFMGSIDISGEQLIFSSENSIILIDQKTRVLLMVKDGQLFKFLNISKPNKKFKQNSTLVSVYNNKAEQMLMIRMLTFRDNTFEEFKYQRLKQFHEQNNRNQQLQVNNFSLFEKHIKTHISDIFCSNGLINPIFTQLIRRFLITKEIKRNSRKSQSIKAQYQQMREFELSQSFFYILIRQYPKELRLVVASILKSKDCYLQDQLSRFLKFMKKIIYLQVNNVLMKYLKRQRNVMREEGSMQEQLVSSSQEEKHKDIQKSKFTLINMSKILQSFIRQIQFQYIQSSQKKESQNILKNQTIHIEKVGKQYKVILKKCHSLFLILDLIEQSSTARNINDFFKKCAYVRARNVKISKQFYTQIQPLLPYEYFYTVNYIGYTQQPKYQEFVQYLLTNLQRFEQIAYFYLNLRQNSPKYPFLSQNLRRFIQLVNFIQFQQKLEENQSTIILSQVARLSLQIKYYPFLKYTCQATIQFNCFNICNLILTSDALQLSKSQLYENQQERSQEIFIIKAYISCRKFFNCYSWIMRRYRFDEKLVQQLISRMAYNGEFKNIQKLKMHIHNKQQLKFVNEIVQRSTSEEDFKVLKQLIERQ